MKSQLLLLAVWSVVGLLISPTACVPDVRHGSALFGECLLKMCGKQASATNCAAAVLRLGAS